jgi:hypothetical protein
MTSGIQQEDRGKARAMAAEVRVDAHISGLAFLVSHLPYYQTLTFIFSQSTLGQKTEGAQMCRGGGERGKAPRGVGAEEKAM